MSRDRSHRSEQVALSGQANHVNQFEHFLAFFSLLQLFLAHLSNLFAKSFAVDNC